MSNRIDELLSRPIPEKLWHYTSIQGFYGIVTSKTMFATDLRFLNDRQEFLHTRQLADEIVGEAPELDADGFQNRKLLAKAISLAFDSGPITRLQVFVASFTAAEDQLGQWRGYSQGSSGVSLAFDPRAFRPSGASGTLVVFAPCVYDPLKKKGLLLNALEHFKEEVSSYHKAVFREACELYPEKRTSNKEEVVKEFLEASPSKKKTFEELAAAATKTRIDCLRIAALLKNSSFEEENEWRLVLPMLIDAATPPKNPPHFRVGKTTLIPYIAHPLSADAALPIVDVILGPGSDENSVFAAQRFLKSRDIILTPRLSKVPYRAS